MKESGFVKGDIVVEVVARQRLSKWDILFFCQNGYFDLLTLFILIKLRTIPVEMERETTVLYLGGTVG